LTNGAIVPGWQRLGCAAPPGQKKPMSQSVQLSLPELLVLKIGYVPASHVAGSCWLLPAGHVYPGAQGMQLIAPTWF